MRHHPSGPITAKTAINTMLRYNDSLIHKGTGIVPKDIFMMLK